MSTEKEKKRWAAITRKPKRANCEKTLELEEEDLPSPTPIPTPHFRDFEQVNNKNTTKED